MPQYTVVISHTDGQAQAEHVEAASPEHAIVVACELLGEDHMEIGDACVFLGTHIDERTIVGPPRLDAPAGTEDRVDWTAIYDGGVCPDCGEEIPPQAVDGSECSNCEHVFVASRSDNHWVSDPNYPVEDWRIEVANDDTRLGYGEWLQHQREASLDEQDDSL